MMGIIKQIKEKIKLFLDKIFNFLKKDIVFYTLLIIFSSSISFFLGSLSEFQKERKKEMNSIQLIHQEDGKKIYYLASKKGKRYYLP